MADCVKQMIERWIDREKTDLEFARVRSQGGYRMETCVQGNRKIGIEGENRGSIFADAQVHQTITESQAFSYGEQIGISIEMLNARDRCAGYTGFMTAYHKHDFFEMIYVYSGSCSTTVEGENCILTEGDLCIYNQKAVHQLGISMDETVVFNILMKKELFGQTFLQLIDQMNILSSFFVRSIYMVHLPSQYLIFKRREGSGIYDYLNRMIMEYSRKQPLYQNLVHANLAGMFIEMSREFREDMTAVSSRESRLDAVQILTFMSVRLRSITLKELSDHFGYTSRSMIRYLRKYTGHTFTELITEFRMTEAGRMLKDEERTVEETAEALGYGSRGYFDRIFREFYSETPSHYRKRHAENLRNQK